MFEIINEVMEDVPELEVLNKYVGHIVKELEIEDAIFNIILVSEDEIHRINREYRGVDRKTDVISFALEDGDTYKNPEIRVLGDIYICMDVAYSQALEYGHSRLREVCFLATHGLLHLLGYDHMVLEEEEIMFAKQEELLRSYDIFR